MVAQPPTGPPPRRGGPTKVVALGALAALVGAGAAYGLVTALGGDDPAPRTTRADETRRAQIPSPSLTDTTPRPAPARTRATSTPPAECLAAAATGRAILEGTTPALTPLRAMAVRSGAGTYLVAVRFAGGGRSGPATGVWLASSLDGDGPFLSVDGVAKQVTDWPDSAAKGVADGAAVEQAHAARCLG